jgi:hypothetical protein
MNVVVHKILLAAAAIAAAGSVWAHHSIPQFDFTKSVTYTGTIVAFTTINPHTRMVIELKDVKGTRRVEFMGHSITSMFRNGYRKGMLKVGDKITVSAAPNKDGTEGGYVTGGHVKGGEYFGQLSGSTAPADTKAVRDEVGRKAGTESAR